MSSASSSCTLDLPSTAKDNKKLPQKHVLLLSPRWRSDQHGIAAVTHHLVDNLRTIDPTGSHIKIYCLVALLDQYIGQEEKLEARKSHVVLLGARPPRYILFSKFQYINFLLMLSVAIILRKQHVSMFSFILYINITGVMTVCHQQNGWICTLRCTTLKLWNIYHR